MSTIIKDPLPPWRSALALATLEGHCDVARLLLDAGARVTVMAVLHPGRHYTAMSSMDLSPGVCLSSVIRSLLGSTSGLLEGSWVLLVLPSRIIVIKG